MESNATPRPAHTSRGWTRRIHAPDGIERHCVAGDPTAPQDDMTPPCACTPTQIETCRAEQDWYHENAERYYREVATEERAEQAARRHWLTTHIATGLAPPSREAMAIAAWRHREADRAREAWEDACSDYQSTGGY